MMNLYSPMEYLRADAERISESAATVFQGLFIEHKSIDEVSESTGLPVDAVQRWRGALLRRWRAMAGTADEVTREHAPADPVNDNPATLPRSGGRFVSPEEKEDGPHGSQYVPAGEPAQRSRTFPRR